MERFKIGDRVKFRRFICHIIGIDEIGYTAKIEGEEYLFHGLSEEFKPFVTE